MMGTAGKKMQEFRPNEDLTIYGMKYTVKKKLDVGNWSWLYTQ